MVASTRAYSMSGASETASNNRCQTPAFTQSRKRVKMLFQWPNEGGRSRHGLPVRTTHKTASTNRRLFLPLRPGSPGLPRQRCCIFAHWASVKMKRSIRSLNHSQAWMKTPESQQALVVCEKGCLGAQAGVGVAQQGLSQSFGVYPTLRMRAACAPPIPEVADDPERPCREAEAPIQGRFQGPPL